MRENFLLNNTISIVDFGTTKKLMFTWCSSKSGSFFTWKKTKIYPKNVLQIKKNPQKTIIKPEAKVQNKFNFFRFFSINNLVTKKVCRVFGSPILPYFSSGFLCSFFEFPYHQFFLLLKNVVLTLTPSVYSTTISKEVFKCKRKWNRPFINWIWISIFSFS